MMNFSALAFAVVLAATPSQARIHSVSDISHEFSFYMDGRFGQQYVQKVGADARNWGTLHKLDLTNANLLVLCSGGGPVEYSEKTIRHVRRFAQEGGAVLILSDRPAQGEVPIQALAESFGATFLPEAAQKPLTPAASLKAKSVEFYGGGTLRLEKGWTVLVSDAKDRPVMARRRLGKGCVAVAVRGLFGREPSAKDPINAEWVTPLLQNMVRNRPVNAASPPRGQSAELSRMVGSLKLEYTEGTQEFAEAIVREYAVVKKHLIEVTGVPPSQGTLTTLLILPTGGGGFSSGSCIGIGAWWGDFPKNRYPMIELIGHEATHSWVLPHPEPVWNEPIATYLGIEVGKRLGMKEAQATLDAAIERARRLDPKMDRIDLLGKDVPNEVVWGKTYWIFEQLRAKYGRDAIAKYFKAKRALVPAGRKGYTLDDCVAVWSNAVGEDLFPYFRSLGISVDRSRTDLRMP